MSAAVVTAVERREMSRVGRHHVCTHCSFSWTAPGMPRECPHCRMGMHWIEDHFTATDAAARAAAVDPAEVAHDLEYFARARRDRAAREARTAPIAALEPGHA